MRALSSGGQYYYIDGAYDTSSPLTVPVTDGAVYGIFANEKNTTGENYGYKYNVWIHERSDLRRGRDGL